MKIMMWLSKNLSVYPVMDMSPDCMLCIYSIIQVVEAEVKNLNLQP